MALTLSQLAQDVQARRAFPAVTHVYYKRFFFKDSTGVMAYEGSWTMVPESELEEPPRRIWKLDTYLLNAFKSSNATFKLKNKDGKWLKGCAEGVFAPDAGSWRGYVDRRTMFQVRDGFIKDDGTTEEIAVFTGYLIDIQYDELNALAAVTIQGRDLDCSEADAEDANVIITDEELGFASAGGGYTLAHDGVSRIDKVKRVRQATAGAIDPNATWEPMLEALDYTVASLNDPAVNPVLTPVVQWTGSGAAYWKFYCSYRYANRLKTAGAFVTDLLTAAGFAPADILVTEPSLPGGVLHMTKWRVQADWQAANKTFCMVANSDGSITPQAAYKLDNWSDGDYTSNPVWTPQDGSAWTVVTDGSGSHWLKGNGANKT